MSRRVQLVVLAVVLLGSLAGAEIPQMISYQGKVTDSSGSPVADNTYTMRFRIYNASSGGTMLWDSSNQNVTVSGGVFNVLLGESPQPALTLDFSADYWLLVTFAGVDQTPRQRLASVGYAYMASGLVPGTVVSGSVTTGSSAAIAGVNTSATGSTYGTYGQVSSTAGAGLYGWAAATTGYPRGVVGVASSPTGTGVLGYSSATSGANYGVYGYSPSPNGRGVSGYALATSGEAHGVHGESASTAGCAIYGAATATTGNTYGGLFLNASSNGRGIWVEATATTGSPVGGRFETNSPTSTCVSGWAYATTGSPTAVSGGCTSSSGTGVEGFGGTAGVSGLTGSTTGMGLWGTASATTGTTYGGKFDNASTSGCGVYAYASASTGSTNGVVGRNNSTSGIGVSGAALPTTGVTYGVRGQSNSPSGYGVYYVGGLGGTGLMRSIVLTSQGPTGLDAVTAAGNWVEDFGTSHLVDGKARIEFDPIFLETVTIDGTHQALIFVQLGGESPGVFVRKGSTGFDVVEIGGGRSSIPFDFRVIAHKRGFEDRRLEVVEAAGNDSFLYAGLREKELRGYEEERMSMVEAQAVREQHHERMRRGFGQVPEVPAALLIK